MAGPTSVTDSIELMIASAQELVPHVEAMNWTIEHDRKARFISSDTPLTLWRPATPRDRFEGIGIKSCAEIRVPLDPCNLLILHRERRPTQLAVSTERPRQCNADTARGCHMMLFGSAGQQPMIDSMPLRAKRPVLRFATGPGIRELPDGSTEPMGEILHNWVPRQ